MNKPGYKPKLGTCACGQKAVKRKASADVCSKCDAIEQRMYQHGHVKTTCGVRKQVNFECV